MNQQTIHRELSIANGLAGLPDVHKFIQGVLDDSRVNRSDANLFRFGAVEAVTSILTQASSGEQGAGTVAIQVDASDVALRARISDNTHYGEVLTGTTEEFEQIRHSLTGRELAVFAINRVMDEVSYRWVRGFENTLELVRYIKPHDEK
jgi:anti-sigma regulatory factor (Ser/Thr protein kinase)